MCISTTCLAFLLLSNFGLLQLTYSGAKKYTEQGAPQTETSPRQEVTIPGKYESFSLRDLTPKMKYNFNISAVFQDGITGPPVPLIVETRIEGIT